MNKENIDSFFDLKTATEKNGKFLTEQTIIEPFYVLKRNGNRELLDPQKIFLRLQRLADKDEKFKKLNINKIVEMTTNGLKNGMTTNEIDILAAENAAYLVTYDYHYNHFAANILISNIHKETPNRFSEMVSRQKFIHNIQKGKSFQILSDKFVNLVMKYSVEIDEMIVHERDFLYDYIGIRTMIKSYLKKTPEPENKIIDRPQYMYMRVALTIHGTDFKRVKETYDLMSTKAMIHATPTLFNSGNNTNQLSSCFLLVNQSDSITGIFNTYYQEAQISKLSGGIGISFSGVRANQSYVAGTNGKSKGIIPFIKIADCVSSAVDQGGKRNGAFAVYLEPWHADIFDFVQLRRIGGDEERRCRNIFTALWIPDLFFERLENNDYWSLFCPNESPGLENCWGENFNKLYKYYESQPDKVRRRVLAKDLWNLIIDSKFESGLPYLLAKDSCNRKSNQQHIGTIQCSNLCCEIIQYSSKDEISVCTLANVGLPACIVKNQITGENEFDFHKLNHITRVLTRNLNNIIDINDYPDTGFDNIKINLPENIENEKDINRLQSILMDIKNGKYNEQENRCRYSSQRHRPIGIGVQGLADIFMLLRLPFDSEKAFELNREIFETMYYASLSESIELSREFGSPFETYKDSPISRGIYQFDLWNVIPSSKRWNWKELDEQRKKFGVRNSLLIAVMPTKSTSHILGYTECIEPSSGMIYKMKVSSGEFISINKYLIAELESKKLWNEKLCQEIISNDGSIQKIDIIPQDIKNIYKTVWDIPQKVLIDMAVDRSPYIDQSQSMNLFISHNDRNKTHSMFLYAWKKGLKTLNYYLHCRAASKPFEITIDPYLTMKKEGITNLHSNEKNNEHDVEKDKENNSSCIINLNNEENNVMLQSIIENSNKITTPVDNIIPDIQTIQQIQQPKQSQQQNQKNNKKFNKKQQNFCQRKMNNQNQKSITTNINEEDFCASCQ